MRCIVAMGPEDVLSASKESSNNQHEPSLSADLDDTLFFCTSLRPKRTGLLFMVYVRPKGCAAHGPRIRASSKYGDKVSEGDEFSITIEDQPLVIGETNTSDVQMAKKWVQINKEERLRLWEDVIDVFDANLQHV